MERNKLVWLGSVFFLILYGVLYFDLPKSLSNLDSPVTIILSPHFDDAVLSLGGLISTHPYPLIIATFFTGMPKREVRTEWDKLSGFPNSRFAHIMRYRENSNALYDTVIKNYGYLDYQYDTNRSEDVVAKFIKNDIENLLALYPDRQIKIYGPSIFTDEITHPDHKIVHEALYDVFLKHRSNSLISFYFYEDFPYIEVFEKQSTVPILDFLGNYHPEAQFVSITIPLSKKQINQKLYRLMKYHSQIKALSPEKPLSQIARDFMMNRCASDKLLACEVVYRVQ